MLLKILSYNICAVGKGDDDLMWRMTEEQLGDIQFRLAQLVRDRPESGFIPGPFPFLLPPPTLGASLPLEAHSQKKEVFWRWLDWFQKWRRKLTRLWEKEYVVVGSSFLFSLKSQCSNLCQSHKSYQGDFQENCLFSKRCLDEVYFGLARHEFLFWEGCYPVLR